MSILEQLGGEVSPMVLKVLTDTPSLSAYAPVQGEGECNTAGVQA